jgi:hypothetical protein
LNFAVFFKVFVKSDITTHYGEKKGFFDSVCWGRIREMRCILGFILLSLFHPILVGCEGDGASAQGSQMAPSQGDTMDISTWDFGEVETNGSGFTSSSNQSITSAPDQYAIVVATFTGDYHAQSAEATYSTLLGQYPTIGRKLTVRPRSRGSALTYGDYQGYDDARAKEDIAMLRKIPSPQGTPLFAQVMLMKFKVSRLKQDLHPHDLWTVRREYPTIVPIFTLEVAVWGDFESGQFPNEKRRAAAQGYAEQLRKKGFEAFFYHNDDAGLSSVTVGLFGHSAVDAETGFYSAEVDALLTRFPVRLVNGEEVLVYFDPSNPSLGSNVQPPALAEVPVD